MYFHFAEFGSGVAYSFVSGYSSVYAIELGSIILIFSSPFFFSLLLFSLVCNNGLYALFVNLHVMPWVGTLELEVWTPDYRILVQGLVSPIPNTSHGTNSKRLALNWTTVSQLCFSLSTSPPPNSHYVVGFCVGGFCLEYPIPVSYHPPSSSSTTHPCPDNWYLVHSTIYPGSSLNMERLGPEKVTEAFNLHFPTYKSTCTHTQAVSGYSK